MDEDKRFTDPEEWNTEDPDVTEPNVTDPEDIIDDEGPEMSPQDIPDSEIITSESPEPEVPLSEGLQQDQSPADDPETEASASDDLQPESSSDDAAQETPSPASAIPPQDRPHDFDVDEPRYDTQTGERLDRPKKKYPGIILTFIVSALAIGAFVYAVLPGKLPSSGGLEIDEVENETSLAIASTEKEEELSAVSSVQTEADEAAQTESEPEEYYAPAAETEEETETEDEEEAGEETESEIGDETESETETESGTEKQTAEAENNDSRDSDKSGIPEFKTEGVILSATLDVSDMVEEVMPGIVSITCTNIRTVQDFFYGRQEIRQTDAGSGIIVDEDEDAYYIVTDAWIISEADELTVGFSVSKEATKELSDEDTLAQASVIGIDEDTELALLMVEKDSVNEVIRGQVKPSVLGDSDSIRVGERAIAIGNAMGYGLSVTEGIVSALNRQMSSVSGVHSYIQTDASINYGNYGGALLNQNGEVIGINSGKISRDSGEGMGYAFPINSAEDAILKMLGERGSGLEVKEELPETELSETKASDTEAPQTENGSSGEVMLQMAESETQGAEDAQQKESEEEESEEAVIQEPESDRKAGVLGVNVADVSDEYSIIYRIPRGAYIASIVEGSGAQAAGLRDKDVIIRINDKEVTNVSELRDALSETKAGDKVKVTYVRPDGDGDYDEDRPSSVTVTLQ